MSLEKIASCVVGGIFQGVCMGVIASALIPLNSRKRKVLLFLLTCIYGIVSLMFVKNELRFFTTIFFLFFVQYFVLDSNNKNIMLYSIIIVILLSISEIIITSSLVIIGINSKDIVNNYFYNLITNILVSIFSIFISLLPLFKKIISILNNKFHANGRLSKYLFVMLLSIYLIVSKNGLELVLKNNYYINILFILVVVFIVTIIVKNEFKYEQLSEENKQMLNYVTKYEKIITEQGKANHEFKNQLMVIRGYAQMNSSKLIDYLDSIVDDIKKTQSSYLISNLNKFPDGGIKGLLYYKLSVMDDEKIKYEIDVENNVKSKLNNFRTSLYKNITKILGVLLDNAIEASKSSKDKKIMIVVTVEKNEVIFKIYNSYKGKIDISKIGTGYTTKGNGHGYGLKLAKDIVNNNSELSIEKFLDDDYYVSVLKVKKTSKQ